MRVVLLGPPGVGKGTQAGRIVDRFGGVHIAPGEMLRADAELGTELGRTARSYMDRGELVPDEVIVDLVLERVGRAGRGGFVLDGFPRTVPQAQALDRRLHELGCPLDAVVSFELGEEELRQRLAGRAGEQHRAEDHDEQAIRRRLELFHRETGPLLDHYDHGRLLVRVDAHGRVEQVNERVVRALAARGGGR